MLFRSLTLIDVVIRVIVTRVVVICSVFVTASLTHLIIVITHCTLLKGDKGRLVLSLGQLILTVLCCVVLIVKSESV